MGRIGDGKGFWAFLWEKGRFFVDVTWVLLGILRTFKAGVYTFLLRFFE